MKTVEEFEAMIRNDPHVLLQMVTAAVLSTPGTLANLAQMAEAKSDSEKLRRAQLVADTINNFIRTEALFNAQLSQALALVQSNNTTGAQH